MTTLTNGSDDGVKAARAREGQQADAMRYQRAVGRVLADLEHQRQFGDAAAFAALQAAGLTPSRGGQWTGQILQGIRARIRARCRAVGRRAGCLSDGRVGRPSGECRSMGLLNVVAPRISEYEVAVGVPRSADTNAFATARSSRDCGY